MTDTLKLEKAIAKSGYMKQFLAEQLGISRSYFLMKTKGEAEFKASEIVKLGELLKLDTIEIDEIFLN